MEQDSITARFQALLETKWRPRLKLTTSERDNLLRWDGSQKDHFEVYQVAAQLPQHKAALWLRHEIRLTRDSKISPRLRVMAVLYDHASSQHLTASQAFAISELQFDRRRFALSLGPCELTHWNAKGHLKDGAISWDLSWEPRRITNQPLLMRALYGSDFLPSKILIPNDHVPLWGSVHTPQRAVSSIDGHAFQAHLWGRRSPLRWLWIRTGRFEGRNDCSFEAAQVQDWVDETPSPWAYLLRLKYRHKSYQFVRAFSDRAFSSRLFSSQQRASSKHSLTQWSFAEGRGKLFFRGTVTARPNDFVVARIEDPNGGTFALHTAAGASARIEVLRRHGLSYRSEAVLLARQSCWYEYADPVTDPRVLHRL